MSIIKPVFKCCEEFKQQFHEATCLLTISVGQEVHEGEKFSSTIQLIDKHFKSCVILVDDTLQRHSMAINQAVASGDDLLEVSLKAGDDWLIRNKHVYTSLHIPYRVMRWNDWLYHPKFSASREKIVSVYTHDGGYHQIFEDTIDEFLTRYSKQKNHDYLTDPRARGLCLEYLFEECTAMCLWPELGCEYEVYPSGRNDAMTETHLRFVLPYHAHLLHSVAIKFKNRRQLSPQTFEFLANFMDNGETLQVATE